MREFFAQFGTITDIVRMTDKATGKQIDKLYRIDCGIGVRGRRIWV